MAVLVPLTLSLKGLRKDSRGVGGGYLGSFVRGTLPHISQLGQGVSYEGRFVALTSVRDRSEVGAVGFNDYAVGRKCAEHLRKGGLLVGENTSDAEHETFKGKQCLSLLKCAAKAMEDACQTLAAMTVKKRIEFGKG